MVSHPHRPQSGHITCDLNRTYHVLPTTSRFPLDFCFSEVHTSAESPLRRAVSSRSEAQHPLRRTISPGIEPKDAEGKLTALRLTKGSLSSHGIKFMFVHQARETRLVSAYLLFMIALVMAPRADIPETLFDEANTPTNEIVVQKAASSWEDRQSVTAFVPRIFAQPRRTRVRRILPVYADRLTDSRTFRELFCSLLC